MKIIKYSFFCKVTVMPVLFLFNILPCLNAQAAPAWVSNLERSYPSREWIAVTAQGSSQPQAESAAMNSLARAFKTDVTSITQASQQFTQIVNNSESKRTINFEESSNFLQDVNFSANIKGLIGVQIDVYRDNRGTVHVCARMNRSESAARYSGMIRENTAIINTLLAAAAAPGTFETYARLSFAHALAQVTDNFQNILEVLDPASANRRPSYGGAASIKTKMIECASLITIGIAVNTEQAANKTLFTRAAGSFFRDHGFKTNEQGAGDYTLRANIRLEDISQNVNSCRYYFDASLESRNGTSVFSFTEDDRKAHPNSQPEARRLAAQAVETSIKEAKFANEFNSWLNSFIN